MQHLLDKKVSELTVFEAMKYAYLISMSSKITMTLTEFCELTGKTKRSVYTLLRSKFYPEQIILGGYNSFRQRKSPIFITEEVLKWIK